MIGNIKPKFSGNIVKPSDSKNLPEPGNLTEEEFISILDAGVYDTKYIGSKVTINNSYSEYASNNIYTIADANHDSANTGQNNCYDLIADCVIRRELANTNFDSSSSDSLYKYLNNTFYYGFNTNFINHIMQMRFPISANYSSQWVTLYITIPSTAEVNLVSKYYWTPLGIPYPIFTDNDSRKRKYPDNEEYYSSYWARDYAGTGIYGSNKYYYIDNTGVTYTASGSYDKMYFVPLFRVQ